MDDIISVTSTESDVETLSSSEASTDVFYIYRPPNNDFLFQSSGATYQCPGWREDELDRRSCKNVELIDFANESVSKKSNALNYVKHTNLDTQALTFAEKFHLRRLRYLNPGNAVRLLIVLLCFGWFSFNAYIVFHDYLKFETVVFMEFRSPKSTLPPAISICTENILENVPGHVIETMSVSDVFEGEKFKEFFQRDGDNIQCFFTYATVGESADQILNCSDLIPLLISIQEGRRCVTYFSNISGEMSRLNRSSNGTFEFDFESFPSIRLVIFGTNLASRTNLWNEEQKRDLISDVDREMSTTGLFLSLHDPTQIHFMNDLPMHSIPLGKYFDSRFEKKIEDFNLTTGCFAYPREKVRKPNYKKLFYLEPGTNVEMTEYLLSEFRSRGECFAYCISRLLNYNKCVNTYSVLTKDVVEQEYFHRNFNANNPDDVMEKVNFDSKQAFCTGKSDTLSQYLITKQSCLKLCPMACSTETYDFNTNFITDNFDENVTVIEIQWAPDPITYIAHKEKFDNYEFIGNLGGVAHIWLGVSVIHVIRYIVTTLINGYFVGLDKHSICSRWFSKLFSRS